MKRHVFVAIVAAFALMLTGCDAGTALDDSETAVATFVVEAGDVVDSGALAKNDQFFPFSFFNYPACTELVDIEGYFHPVNKSTVDGSGGFHVKSHINAKGTGVGQVSGATYQWNDSINMSEHVSGPFPTNYTHTQTLLLIGQGAVPNLKNTLRVHYTVNANGDVTVDRYEFTPDCQD